MKSKNKTLRISELITELEYFKKQEGDIEVFVVMEVAEEFVGVQKSFVLKVPGGETYLSLLTNGDVLKIGGNILGAMKYEK